MLERHQDQQRKLDALAYVVTSTSSKPEDAALTRDTLAKRRAPSDQATVPRTPPRNMGIHMTASSRTYILREPRLLGRRPPANTCRPQTAGLGRGADRHLLFASVHPGGARSELELAPHVAVRDLAFASSVRLSRD